MKKQKNNSSRKSFKGWWILPARIIFWLFFVIFILYIALMFLENSLKNISYFQVKDVITNEKKVDLSYFKGRNIFTINLSKESAELSQAYPSYRVVRLIRILPDRLFVEFIKRQPVAIVKLYRNFYVDNERVFFTLPEDSNRDSNLPVILGLDTKIFGAKSDRKYDVKELFFALDLINEAQRYRMLRILKIKSVNVEDLSRASFIMLIPVGQTAQELEIKIGNGDVHYRLRILVNLLIHMRKDLINIKYYDLRFKEPVIKYISP